MADVYCSWNPTMPVSAVARTVRTVTALALLLAAGCRAALAVDASPVIPIVVGAGSYASAPPSPSPELAAFLAHGARLDPSLPAGTPAPSNDWWSHALYAPDVGRLWAYPLVVGAAADGVSVWLPELDPPQKEFRLGTPLVVSATVGGVHRDLPPACQTALRWGDWTLTLRLRAEDQRWLDLTCGRGLPFAWIEAKGLGLAIPGQPDDAITGLDGAALPASGANGAVIVREGRHFALYAVGGKLMPGSGGGLVPAPGPAITALAVAALPDGVAAATWRAPALAVPRDSVFAWNYDREHGRVDTTWTLRTEPLAPGAGQPLQGWLPHQWRGAPAAMAFAPGDVRTPRGRLRLQSGTTFHWSWRFTGVLPALPPPTADGPAPRFDPDRLGGYLKGFAAERLHGPDGKPQAAGDSYWGGKDLLQYVQTGLIAHAVHAPDDAAITGAGTALLEDWFTWTPGEKDKYFARYDRLGALIGFNPSYGSEQFTDNHFHYGYFTMASAMTMVNDHGFRDRYGAMATLVAKQYANWDRADRKFPFLRTFEPWCGHSYAAGISTPDIGNNQESSSEAMNAWAGLALLGAALGDRAMTDCGAMGYAIEGEAIQEYWNDYHAWKDGPTAANFPPGYGHPMVGILNDNGNVFGTFFNAQPRFIYGIQWLPLTPSLQYLGWDPAFGQAQWDAMVREQQAVEPDFSLSKLDGGWDLAALGYQMVNDPERTAQTFEDLWTKHDPIATGHVFTPTIYYLLHAWRRLGTLAPDAWTDQPTACVYRKGAALTLVAWNPGATDLTVTVHADATAPAAHTVVPAGALIAWPVPAKNPTDATHAPANP
jgi:hypothetical protein